MAPGWSLDSENSDFVFANNAGIQTFAWISVAVGNVLPSANLEALTDERLDLRRTEGKSVFELVSRANTTLSNGQEFTSITYRYREDPQYCVTLRTESMYVLGESIYTVQTTVCEAKIDTYLPALRAMQESFVITRQVPTATATATATATPTPSPPPAKTQTYIDPTGLWSIVYPSGWDVTGPTTSENSQYTLVETIFNRPRFFADITVSRYDGLSWLDLDGLSEIFLGAMKGEIVETRRVVISGHAAILTEFVNDTFSRAIVHISAGAQRYEVTASVANERWELDKDMLASIVLSFQPTPLSADFGVSPTPIPIALSSSEESVILVYANDPEFIVERLWGERLSLDAKSFCLTGTLYEGFIVKADIGFLSSKITFPNNRSCDFWTEGTLGRVRIVSSSSDGIVIQRDVGGRWLLEPRSGCFSLFSGTAYADFGFVSTTLYKPGSRPCETWTRERQ